MNPSRCCREPPKQIMSCLDYHKDCLYSECPPPLGPIQPVLQGSAVLSILLLASAVPHLLLNWLQMYLYTDTLPNYCQPDLVYGLSVGCISLLSRPASSQNVTVLLRASKMRLSMMTKCDSKRQTSELCSMG